MELHGAVFLALTAAVLATVAALPTSLVDEIKASELRDNKVKRSRPEIASPEERVRDVPYYSKPTAIKRGASLHGVASEEEHQSPLGDWEREQQQQQQQQRASFQPDDELANLQSALYAGPVNPYDDKTPAEYEKGFHYGAGKDRLDEALENAVLKSELYGEPAAVNQYRYYGLDDRRRRKRRETRKARLEGRIKREIDLTPEELLAILSLYENERRQQQQQQQQKGYRGTWRHPDLPNAYDPERDDNDLEDDDEDWLERPVYPHSSSRADDLGPYYGDDKPQMYEKRGRWGSYADRSKRFMVAKKRNDPTRELRYLNGPSKNDFYTLSQLLSNDREPDVPLYHRLVL